MSSPKSADELVQILRNTWPDLDETVARHDVETFLKQLQLHDLTEISG